MLTCAALSMTEQLHVTRKSLVITKIILIDVFFFIADITPEEIFNMFFGGFGGASMSGGKEMRLQAL